MIRSPRIKKACEHPVDIISFGSKEEIHYPSSYTENPVDHIGNLELQVLPYEISAIVHI